MIYALLPVWQAEFGLQYASLAVLRSIYAGTMASLQLPAGRLAEWIGSRATLALGTLLAAVGYAVAGWSGGLLGLCIALGISGSGSSVQHPVASAAVSRVYGRAGRVPLSIYNFGGDLGKSLLPAAISILVTVMPWRHALWMVSGVGCIVAATIALLFPDIPENDASIEHASQQPVKGQRRGFSVLVAIGVLDTAVRMGLLIFLPFLLKEKGVSQQTLGIALALVFIGGAAGKFTCGWLAARLGVVATVLTTECGTAAAIIAVIFLPMWPSIVLLPMLGMMLNGTSSALYGTVPELTTPERTGRAFALFYTGTIASGAISPILYGFLGDHVGIHRATLATAITAAATFPLAIALRSHLTAAE